jgi:hypothetical protein
VKIRHFRTPCSVPWEDRDGAVPLKKGDKRAIFVFHLYIYLNSTLIDAMGVNPSMGTFKAALLIVP